MKHLHLILLLIFFTSLVLLHAQDRSALNYRNPNIQYTGDANAKVTNPDAGKALMRSATYKYISLATFSLAAVGNYSIVSNKHFINNNNNNTALLSANLGLFYGLQTFNALSYHQFVKAGKALLKDENFQLDNLTDPERKIKVSKLMKNHPGTLLVKGGRLLKAGAYMNMISPIAGIGGLAYYEYRFDNRNRSENAPLSVALSSGGFTMVTAGSIIDFIGYSKIAKAGKILQNHTATNVSYAGKQLKQSARLHKWIYIVPLLTGAALMGNAYLHQNDHGYDPLGYGYYAIAYTGCGAMLTFDLISTAKLKKAGKLLAGE